MTWALSENSCIWVSAIYSYIFVDKVNAKEEEETPFDVFGKSFTMQLKKNSMEMH